MGQSLTYTINVSNQGPDDEPDAAFAASLPPGMSVDSVSASQGLAPTVNQGLVSIDLGELSAQASQSATVTLVVSPGPSNVGSATAGFAVQGQNVDPVASNDSTQVTVNVAPTTDLSVAITPGPGPAIAQTDWTYTVKVSNPGPSDATGVIATSTLPPGVQFVSASSSGGVAPTELNGTITAALGSLAAGSSASVSIVVQPTPATAADGSMLLSAAVAGNEANADPSQAQASLKVPVAPSVEPRDDPDRHAAVDPERPVHHVHDDGQQPRDDPGDRRRRDPPGLEWAVLPVRDAQPGGQCPGRRPAHRADRLHGSWRQSSPSPKSRWQRPRAPSPRRRRLSVAEYNLNPQGASASTTAQVLESAGIVQFGTPNLSVSNLSGVAVIPVVRLYGTNGSITVNYRTIAINATPGLDFTPTSGTLTMGPGQSSATISVPVLDDIYENHDDLVNVVLEAPTGGAVLGNLNTADLQIVDTNPDVTPPQVTGLTWTGSSQAISNLTLSFTAPLDPNEATNPANYHLVNLSSGGNVPIASIQYNSASFSVTIVPASPLPSGQYEQIRVVGTGPTAIRDIAGNILSGNGSGTAGSDYVATFAQGNRLQYQDSSGNLVTLQDQGCRLPGAGARCVRRRRAARRRGHGTAPHDAHGHRQDPQAEQWADRARDDRGPRTVRRCPRADENPYVPGQPTPLPEAWAWRLLIRCPAMDRSAALTIGNPKGYIT